MRKGTPVQITIQLSDDVAAWLLLQQHKLAPVADLSAVLEHVLRDAMTVAELSSTVKPAR